MARERSGYYDSFAAEHFAVCSRPTVSALEPAWNTRIAAMYVAIMGQQK